MNGSHSRTKGHSFERLIARKLRAKWPEARRGLQYQHGEHCPDIVGTPFYIECKRHAKITCGMTQRWRKHAKEKRELWGVETINAVLIVKQDRCTIAVYTCLPVKYDIDNENKPLKSLMLCLDGAVSL